MIDEIKKSDSAEVYINIFKLDPQARKHDIYETFKDVKIGTIVTNF